ncbi:PAS domain-containing sensor histidine kinase [Acuticoccus sp. I52.16.1]|uniref:sensor histidine kinase n=1 Tax=Acuticoccus sp. I52.16.1 TaxID=2928472 RepID=UPI001FD5682F|nr:PAS domain-containing sensor histidine kinase [Acuticoccus sp. I52.16.1]UOM35941.1 PAS-domain containing protein [Acuticoccus sp. I52.16.1]
MLTAWAVTAAASALAGLVVARARHATRAAAGTAHDRSIDDARIALAELALARGALGAARLMPSGDVIACGEVPAAVVAALEAPRAEGPLAAAARQTGRTGQPFRLDIAAEAGPPRLVTGSLEGGHPTLFVEPAPEVCASAPNDAAGRLGALITAAPYPAWVEGEGGATVWSNPSYSRAIGGAAHGGDSLLDANARTQLGAGEAGGPVHQRVQTVVAGERRHLDVSAEMQGGTLAALAVDVTDTVHAMSVQARALESHAATFDLLATAVAIYGPDRRLVFHNAAFQRLFELPGTFLEHAPFEDQVLDRLRAERRLPETADFKAWKRDQLKGYETRESFERWWHLPDGQTLRVVANPGADGGVTYVYENVTQQLALERQYNALSRVQAETIDNLGEGIASFGPDGLLRLANPAFWTLTDVPPVDIGEHVNTIAAKAPDAEAGIWAALTERVTGLTDHRTPTGGRMERATGRTLDYAFSPLPDGSTLATFSDVTDSVNIAKALVDRNNALVEADRLKNAFIEHVSYELRSPLNSIIGFTQLLTRPETGDLSAKQRDYANFVLTSSEALLVIIDGVLDLASIDAGVMELTIAPVDVTATMRQVCDGLKDRIVEAGLDVEVAVADDARVFPGDEMRVRQVLFNLVSNAVTHSPPGASITVASRRDGDYVALSVRDRGPGISEDNAEAVFERFNTSGAHGRRRGVGLGLSLVKSFVELHGGTVSVAPTDGPGAELVVRFPRQQAGVETHLLDAA